MINGNKIGLWDGIIIIVDIDKGKAKKIYVTAQGTDEDKFITLNDCLKLIDHDGESIVLVIFETPLHGEIYQYGNRIPPCWEKHGTTKGYA